MTTPQDMQALRDELEFHSLRLSWAMNSLHTVTTLLLGVQTRLNAVLPEPAPKAITYTVTDIENAVIGACGLLDPNDRWDAERVPTSAAAGVLIRRRSDRRYLHDVLLELLHETTLYSTNDWSGGSTGYHSSIAHSASMLLCGYPHPRQDELLAVLNVRRVA